MATSTGRKRHTRLPAASAADVDSAQIVPVSDSSTPIGASEAQVAYGRLAYWLPSVRQLANGARLRLSAALGPDPEGANFVPGVHTSMRQAFGLIVVVGLVAGLGRMIWMWVTLARDGTVMPLVRIEGWSAWMMSRYSYSDAFALINQQVGGLASRAPAWVAAGLNAVGVWLSMPLRLLTIWIVYGLLMLVVAKLLGAGTTLPRFYAALGYVALPALLLIFLPLPVIGPIAALLAAILALVSAQRAIRAATGMDNVRALMALLLPAVVLLAMWGVLGTVAAVIALV